MINPFTAIVFIIVGFCWIVALILKHIERQPLHRSVPKPKGPRVLPIVGNSHYFIGNTGDIMKKCLDLMEIYPSPFEIRLGNQLLLGIYDADQIKEKVYGELYEIYGGKTSSEVPVQKEDLSRMEYLERVIKETMRLFPVVPAVARYVTEDIKMGDYIVPKGSSVALAIIKLHRYEKYWPDPLKFDPDRFLPEEVSKRHPYSYIPFSVGPRNCLGLRYAMMTMKIIIATVLRSYVLTKDKYVDIKDIEVKMDMLMKPVEPLCIKIVERKVVPNVNDK